jgi:hypothetical protein
LATAHPGSLIAPAPDILLTSAGRRYIVDTD